MKTEIPNLVVLGSINIDHIVNVPHLPQPGETVLGSNYTLAFGGKGANQAVAAGRFGTKISLLGCTGQDSVGKNVLKQLQSDQVHIENVEQVQDLSTGVALIYVDAHAENVIAIHAGANAEVNKSYLQRHQTILEQANALLIQLEIPIDTLIEAVKIAKRHHAKVILNPAPAQPLPVELLQQIDIITPNQSEAEILTGIKVHDEASAETAAIALHKVGIKTVLITLGQQGVWLSQANTEHPELLENIKGKRIPAFQVNAQDTIAAGDTFNGVFVSALLEGKNDNEAIQYANAAAAISVTRKGAQSSIPWRTEIDTFLANPPALNP